VSEVTDENTKNKFAEKFLDTGVVFQPEVPTKSDGRYMASKKQKHAALRLIDSVALRKIEHARNDKWLLLLLHMLYARVYAMTALCRC
jgi:hypothetical protein